MLCFWNIYGVVCFTFELFLLLSRKLSVPLIAVFTSCQSRTHAHTDRYPLLLRYIILKHYHSRRLVALRMTAATPPVVVVFADGPADTERPTAIKSTARFPGRRCGWRTRHNYSPHDILHNYLCRLWVRGRCCLGKSNTYVSNNTQTPHFARLP